MNAREAAKAAGVTLRCLQWWVKTGLVSRSRDSESVRQARIWGMIAHRFGCLRKSLTHSVDVRNSVRSASRSSCRFLVLYSIRNNWRGRRIPVSVDEGGFSFSVQYVRVGAKCLKDERAVLKFGANIPGSMVLIEIPEKERA